MRRLPATAMIGVLALGLAVGRAPAGAESPPAPLPVDPPVVCDPASIDWPVYGQSPARTFSTGCSQITPANVATLVPKWTVKTARTVTASPAVADGRVYVGDWSGTMYAVGAGSGEVEWTYEVDPAGGAAFGPIVSSAAVDDGLVVFGAGPKLYALDAIDGREAWVADFTPPGADPAATPVEIESSPTFADGVIFVGIDTHNREHTGRPGGILAVDPADGALIGTFQPENPPGTDPDERQDRGCGGVWSSPTVDADAGAVAPTPGGVVESGRLYLATANCPRPQAGDGFDWNAHIEAVTALDYVIVATATERRVEFEVDWAWSPHEPFNDDDHDFGATPNLFTIGQADGTARQVVGAGNKNGHYYLFDAHTGEVLGDTEVGDDGYVQDGFAIGGFLGSPAVWDGRVYGGTAIPTPRDRDGSPPFEQTLRGVYAGIDPAGGTVAWRGVQAPTYAASAATNGVIFHGALDDVFRAYDAGTGRVLWAQPLLGPISSGAAIVGDSVYVGSGTSSSDACAKDVPVFSDVCLAAFDTVLGTTGGIHAFHLAL